MSSSPAASESESGKTWYETGRRPAGCLSSASFVVAEASAGGVTCSATSPANLWYSSCSVLHVFINNSRLFSNGPATTIHTNDAVHINQQASIPPWLNGAQRAPPRRTTRFGVFYSCSKAKRDALTSLLSLLVGCNVSVDMLESTDFVEVVERVGNGFFVGK